MAMLLDMITRKTSCSKQCEFNIELPFVNEFVTEQNAETKYEKDISKSYLKYKNLNIKF